MTAFLKIAECFLRRLLLFARNFMKAKNLFLALATAALFLGSAFGMAKNQRKVQVSGVVEYYGNAPFARLGLKSQDGTLYYLDAKREVQDKIGALSGHALFVEGTLQGETPPVEMPGATVLTVKSWKTL